MVRKPENWLPPILSITAIEPGINWLLVAEMGKLRAKSILQTEQLISVWALHRFTHRLWIFLRQWGKYVMCEVVCCYCFSQSGRRSETAALFKTSVAH